ncbi:MAG: DUF58 domain-containing protein [Spirochaetales bacterium]|nr:DUF58 domain-containing protein [Spirochaetales bacterium]
MNSRRAAIGMPLMTSPLILFFLFSRSFLARYVSLFILILVVLAILYAITVPRLVKVRHIDPAVRTIKLQEVTVRLEVRNISPIPISYFTLTDQTGALFAEESSFVVSLRPYEKKTLSFNCRGHNRGEFMVGPVGLKGSTPAGGLFWKKKVETYLRVIVYPSIRRMALPAGGGLPAGSIKTHNMIYEDLTRFRSLREYVPGDDTRRINWKASAKTNRLYSMEYDAALDFPAVVVFNCSMDDYPVRYRDLLIEQAAETAASLVFHFAGLKQKTGFLTTGIVSTGTVFRFPESSGYENAAEILEIIARLKPREGSADFNELLRRGNKTIPMGTRLTVVSPPLTENQAAALAAARRRGTAVRVLVVESPIERRSATAPGSLPAASREAGARG